MYKKCNFGYTMKRKKIGYNFNPYAGMAHTAAYRTATKAGVARICLLSACIVMVLMNGFAAHTVFMRVFITHPTEAAKLIERFPGTIGNTAYNCPDYCGTSPENICAKSCAYKIDGISYRSCGYKSFIFRNPTFDDVKLLVELWKLEHGVK